MLTYLADNQQPTSYADALLVFAMLAGFAMIPVGLATAVWILRKAGYIVHFGDD